MKEELNTFLERERNTWISFHSQSLRESMASWSDEEKAADSGVSRKEAAYETLKHAALLWRYTADEKVLDDLRSLHVDQRRSLVINACAYVDDFLLLQLANELVASDALSDEQIESAEELLLERDGFQAAWDLARQLVADILEHEADLLRALTKARCRITQADDLLRVRPDIVSIASRIMEPFREIAKVTFDKSKYWWFYESREWDAEEEQILADPARLAQSLGLPASAFQRKDVQQPARPADEQDAPASVILGVCFGSSVLRQIEDPVSLGMAAADKKAGHSRALVWPGSLSEFKSICRHSTETAGELRDAKRGPRAIPGIEAHRPQQPPFAYSPVEPAPDFQQLTPAAVEISPRKDADCPERATAQWTICSAEERLPADCPVAVVNLKKQQVIGQAQFDRATNTITLRDGAWRDFEPVAHSPEDVVLIFVQGG